MLRNVSRDIYFGEWKLNTTEKVLNSITQYISDKLDNPKGTAEFKIMNTMDLNIQLMLRIKLFDPDYIDKKVVILDIYLDEKQTFYNESEK